MIKQTFLTPEIEAQLADLVKVELKASQVYHFISIWADCYGYFGAQKYYAKQSLEERGHAQKVIDYILDRNGMPVMPIIPAISIEFANIREVLERTLEEEILVENKWKEFATKCFKVNDLTSFTFAQWCLNEQVQEIATVADYLAILDVLGDTGIAYERVDQILGAQ